MQSNKRDNTGTESKTKSDRGWVQELEKNSEINTKQQTTQGQRLNDKVITIQENNL